MHVYIASFDPDGADEADLEKQLDCVKLEPGLFLIATDQTRSKIYHFVKRRLEPDAALLVGRLDEPPKFKGMSAGATNWVREHFAS